MSWSFATHWMSEGRLWTLDNSSLPPVDGEPVVLDSIPIPDANDVPPPSSPLRGEPETGGKVDEEDEDEDEDEEMEWETLPDYSKKFKEKRKKKKEEYDENSASKKVRTAGSVAGAKAANPAKPKASKAAKAAGSAASKKRKADSDDDDDDDENALPAEAMVKIETTTRSGRKISRPQTFPR
ncbi:hypothetical protein KCU71_g21590, partial [Aureobasidium melanogenum]